VPTTPFIKHFQIFTVARSSSSGISADASTTTSAVIIMVMNRSVLVATYENFRFLGAKRTSSFLNIRQKDLGEMVNYQGQPEHKVTIKQIGLKAS
jgi:hypothetical protein